MKWSKKLFLQLLICATVCWFVSGWLFIGLSYLTPVYFQAETYSKHRQVLFFSPISEIRFPIPIIIHKKSVLLSDRWQKISIALPRHWLSQLRLGFENNRGIITFRKVSLNGQPFDLLNAFHYQTRNVRSCDFSQEISEISCRIAGERAYITFPPYQTEKVAHLTAFKWSRGILFVLCLLLSVFLYKKYGPYLRQLLSYNHTNWIVWVLLSCLLLSYAAMRWYAFAARLDSVFWSASWKHFFILLQEYVWVPALLFIIAAYGFKSSNKILKGLLFIGGFGLIFTEIIDCALLYLLNARFLPQQISEYGMDTLFSMGPFIKSYFRSTAGMHTLLLLFSWAVLCVFMWQFRVGKRTRQVCYALAALGLIWCLLPTYLTPTQKTQLYNLPRLWLQNRKSSTGLAQLPTVDFHLTYQCQDGLNSRQNIIIILLESFSSYMSDYFSDGKAENWTPRLDKLAKQYNSLKNYRTTGPDTTQSLFSIFTGIPAIYFFKESNLYREPKFYQHTLAKTFHHAGYYTAFFTSASWVYSKDYILKNAGFDKISKDTDPFYHSKKRFVFNSVSDDVLYDHAEDWLTNYPRKEPYLLVLETTTTHNPFINPRTGEESLEDSVRYADEALGNFIEHLKERKLLDNTIVVITSDHRIMQLPPTEEQLRIFGPETEARIPFVIIGAPTMPNTSVPATHMDLAPSLEYATLPQACFHPYQYNLFTANKTRSSCTLFLSFVEKHKVLVNCQDQRAEVHLSSKSNDLVQTQISPQQQDSILSFINWIRDNNRY